MAKVRAILKVTAINVTGKTGIKLEQYKLCILNPQMPENGITFNLFSR
jgi:hypothetical protein